MAIGKRCQFWLPNKRRFCANSPLPSSRFCGNHDPASGAPRLPCPIDPSHSVSEDNMESHIKRCPLKKQAQALESQPYYTKGINSCDAEEGNDVTSADKRNAVLGLPASVFYDLLEKIKAIHSTLSVVFPESYAVPDACSRWLNRQLDRRLPYQEKHVLQQASIIGNMEAFGILQKPDESKVATSGEGEEPIDDLNGEEGSNPAVVEFGAGRGYTTHMLADCYGIRKVFLVERRSYKLKADRSLRQNQGITLQRLRIDIEDLNLPEVNLLKGLSYLAIGKHLCGPATDLTLRCCLNKKTSENKGKLSSDCHLQGIAIATCCHHLCQWKNYANTKLMLDMGITKEDFHAMTWFTSWAVDADHSCVPSDMIYQGIDLNTRGRTEYGLRDRDIGEAIRSMSALERALLAFMCKEIIDIGRLLWLRDHGMDAQLVKYVPSIISPENHLLLAKDGCGLYKHYC